MIGKYIRLDRIKDRETGKFVILPIDHGVTIGPVHGIKDIGQVINWAAEGGATAIVEHKGMVRAGYRGNGRDIGLIVHLSASTAVGMFPDSKTIVGSVEEAVKLGADAVSIHVNIGDVNESGMLADFGKISKDCLNYGMPLLAMVYARGKKIKNCYDKELVAHCARLAAEMGADVVKVSYTGDVESFRYVVSSTPIPVLIAGGEKCESDREVLKMVEDAMKAGAAGISIGRNVFQHAFPRKMLNALVSIVKRVNSAEKAYELLNRGI
jgi:class I fructose-bisphosphate aldolase